MRPNLLVAERLQHALDGLALAALPVPGPGATHDIRGSSLIPRAEQVDHALRDVALLEVPRTGATAEGGHGAGFALLQLGSQEVGEELMVSIPAAGVVFGRDEEVVALQVQQDGVNVVALGDGETERRRQMLEHGGVEQESLDLRRLRREDLGE